MKVILGTLIVLSLLGCKDKVSTIDFNEFDPNKFETTLIENDGDGVRKTFYSYPLSYAVSLTFQTLEGEEPLVADPRPDHDGNVVLNAPDFNLEINSVDPDSSSNDNLSRHFSGMNIEFDAFVQNWELHEWQNDFQSVDRYSVDEEGPQAGNDWDTKNFVLSNNSYLWSFSGMNEFDELDYTMLIDKISFTEATD